MCDLTAPDFSRHTTEQLRGELEMLETHDATLTPQQEAEELRRMLDIRDELKRRQGG